MHEMDGMDLMDAGALLCFFTAYFPVPRYFSVFAPAALKAAQPPATEWTFV